MRTISIILIGFVCLWFTSGVSASIPQWQADDHIQVYILAAPLFKEQYGDLLKNINAFHAGIMFENQRSREQYILDYNAEDMVTSVFPNINEKQEIEWNNNGYIRVTRNMTSYWDLKEWVMTIDGELFNRFVCWAPTYNSTHESYFLWDVFQKGKSFEENIKNPIMPSSSCISFVWYAIDILQGLGAVVPENSKRLKRDVLWLKTIEEPVKVNENDPATHADLVKFYGKFHFDSFVSNMTWKDFMNSILDYMDNTFYYYRSNEGYYRLKLGEERVGFTFQAVDIPQYSNTPIHYANIGQCSALLSPLNTGHIILIIFACILIMICFFTITLIGITIVIYRLPTPKEESYNEYSVIQ